MLSSMTPDYEFLLVCRNQYCKSRYGSAGYGIRVFGAGSRRPARADTVIVRAYRNRAAKQYDQPCRYKGPDDVTVAGANMAFSCRLKYV